MHPFEGVLGHSNNTVTRTNVSASTTSATLTPSGTAYHNITPVQAVASTAYDVGMICLRSNAATAVSAGRGDFLLEIMLGASGSEYTIVGPLDIGGRASGWGLQLPVFIPAGSRISMRMRCARTSTNATFTFDYYGAPGRDFAGLPQGWVAYGLVDDVSANAHGTLVTAGTSNAWGSWTSLTTSTTYAHELWMPMLGTGTNTTMAAVNYRTQWAIASTTDAATMVTNGVVWDGPQVSSTTGEQINDLYTSGVGSQGTYHNGWGIHYAPRAAGASVSVRSMCSGTPDSNGIGYSILAAI